MVGTYDPLNLSVHVRMLSCVRVFSGYEIVTQKSDSGIWSWIPTRDSSHVRIDLQLPPVTVSRLDASDILHNKRENEKLTNKISNKNTNRQFLKKNYLGFFRDSFLINLCSIPCLWSHWCVLFLISQTLS